MAKRIKRSHLKKFSASNMSAPKGFDPNKTAVYDCWSQKARIYTKENPTVVTEEFKIGDKTYIERRQIVRWGQDVRIQRDNKGKLITERRNQVTYLGEVPTTLGGATNHTVKRPKNLEMAQFHEVWQSDRRQGFDTFIYAKLIEVTEDYRLHMFQAGLKVYFIKEYTTLLLRSSTYPTKTMGMAALSNNRLKFTIFEPPSAVDRDTNLSPLGSWRTPA